MKRILFLISFLSFSALAPKSQALPNPPHVDIGVSVGFFQSSLSPHGEWIDVESGLRVWRPLHMHRYWRPYMSGRWVWTDYGWYWMSNEPFGWITYHYGRWYFDDYYGWVWVPDDVWGPAWVEWRYDNDYIGWAPLPPYATFNVSFGIRFTKAWSAPAHYWNFVRYHQFRNDINYRDIATIDHTRRLIHTTRSGMRYDVDNDRIINRGVDVGIIERHENSRISKVEVRDIQGQSGERYIRPNSGRTEQIEIYRPSRDEMQQGIERINARRGDRSLSIDSKKIEKPRIESRISNSERHGRENINSEAPQQPQRVIKPEARTRESSPRVQEQRSGENRKEMRRELIQRYERKQSPTPRSTHESLQKRNDQPRQSFHSRQSGNVNRQSFEKHSGSGRGGNRNRD